MANPLSNRRILIIVVVVAIVVIMLLWVVLAYNGIVSKQQSVNSAESQIKNRYTTMVNTLAQLAPQLANYSQYESSLLTNLTQLQTQWQQALTSQAGDAKLINISSQVDTNYVMLLSTWTNYPDLQYSSLVKQYMGETVDLQEQLSYSRASYNDAVRDYNTGIKSFPMMLFAGGFGFNDRPYWGDSLPGDGTNL